MTGKVTTKTIRKLKGERPIVAITAYDTILARLVDRAGVDLILVGDSVGTTQLGFSTTVPVTMDMMAHHTAAVARAGPRALLVSDIPFAVASHSFDRVLDDCARLMQECGAEAVKIEGGREVAPVISRLVETGIPVLGHIGLLPQRFYSLGGYYTRGKSDSGRERLLDDARALEEAGVFAIIGEMIERGFAKELTESLKVPFIGIGSGPDCDGQILVSTDMLAMGEGPCPGFVKMYGKIGEAIEQAVTEYGKEVRERKFPE